MLVSLRIKINAHEIILYNPTLTPFNFILNRGRLSGSLQNPTL